MDASHSKSTPENTTDPRSGTFYSRDKTLALLGITNSTLNGLVHQMHKLGMRPVRFRTHRGCLEFFNLDVDLAVGFWPANANRKNIVRLLDEYIDQKRRARKSGAQNPANHHPDPEALRNAMKVLKATGSKVEAAKSYMAETPTVSDEYMGEYAKPKEVPLHQIKEVKAINDTWNDPCPAPVSAPKVKVSKLIPKEIAVLNIRQMAAIRGCSVGHFRKLMREEPYNIPPRIEYPGARRNLWSVETVRKWQQQFINTRKVA